MRKLSASAVTAYLKSPRQFFYRYVVGIESAEKSAGAYDHDKIFGSLWAEFVHRFYQGVSEKENSDETLSKWMTQTEGWVPNKQRGALTDALVSLMPQYYQEFSPDDGCRTKDKSELWIEDDLFCGRLDGESDDAVIHEVKGTSRCPESNRQVWKVQNSLQVKLYVVMREARGVCIEFAYKDSPYGLWRTPVQEVSEQKREQWKEEFVQLAGHIYSLGDDIRNYPCNPDGCCLVTKRSVSMCPYQPLCDGQVSVGDEMSQLMYATRGEHK